MVAAEVKELSAQTAKATDAIAEQIHSIQSSTGTAVGAIRSVAGKVAEIQAFTGAIAAAVEEQTAAAQEIANNVARAAEASEKAATSSSEVSEVANQTKHEFGLGGERLHPARRCFAGAFEGGEKLCDRCLGGFLVQHAVRRRCCGIRENGFRVLKSRLSPALTCGGFG